MCLSVKGKPSKHTAEDRGGMSITFQVQSLYFNKGFNFFQCLLCQLCSNGTHLCCILIPVIPEHLRAATVKDTEK